MEVIMNVSLQTSLEPKSLSSILKALRGRDSEKTKKRERESEIAGGRVAERERYEEATEKNERKRSTNHKIHLNDTERSGGKKKQNGIMKLSTSFTWEALGTLGWIYNFSVASVYCDGW